MRGILQAPGRGAPSSGAHKQGRRGAFLLIALTAFALALGAVVGTPTVAHAADLNLDAPEHSKTATKNDDGTYTISLDVTGASRASQEGVPVDVVLVMDTSGSMNLLMGWQSRLQVAQSAANSLISTVLNEENSKLPENEQVQVSIVSFSSDSSKATAYTADATSASSVVNGLRAGGGTNWEGALKEANTASSGRAGAKKYIVFLSDGDPTYRVSQYAPDANDPVKEHGVIIRYGTGISDPHGWNYNAAKDEASRRGKDVTLFSISCAAEADKMQQFAKDVKGSYYNGDSAEALKKAFSDIALKIDKSAFYRNVTVTDTLSEYASFANVDAAGNPTDLKVTKTKGNNTEVIQGADVTYENGKVVWNSGKEELEDGATYTVSFTIKPNQEAYEKAAAEGVNGSLDLYTNGKATLGYTVVQRADDEETSEEGSTTFDSPTMAVPYSTITLTKVWGGEDDNAANAHGPVSIQLWRDGENWGAPVQLSADEGWSSTVNVPVGDGETTWSAVEAEVGGYASTVSNPVLLPARKSGSGAITVTNKRVTGALTVKKVVNGGAANTGEHYRFRLTSDGLNGVYAAEYEGVASGDDSHGSATSVEFKDGVATFVLRHNESVTIKDLPIDASVSIQEVELGGNAKTSTTAKLNDEEAQDVTPDPGSDETVGFKANASTGGTRVLFTNTAELVPQTGINPSNVAPMAGLLAVTAAGAGALALERRCNGHAWKE